jgi:hypothetical protein
MYRKKNLLIACVSVFLVVLMFSAIMVSAQPTVGVEVGDWAGYGDMSFEYATNIPGEEDPPEELNMSWTDVEVLDVSGSNVTCRSTNIYVNGTERIDIMCGDVETGEGNLSIGIIPSNLGAGDEIPANLTWFTEEPMKLTINGTVTRSYAGANREVNYVNITSPIVYGNVTLGTQKMFFCWDKETGVICEEGFSYAASYTVNMTQYYMNMSMLWRMTTTNMWPAVFTVQDGYAFNVTMLSNSTISNFNFNETLKQISFNVTGPTNKTGYCNITIPKDLLRDSPWTILLNDTDWTTLCDITDNTTHTFIYIPYNCSTNTIQIIGTWAVPEFPSAVILPLLMIATMVSVILCGRQRKT